MWYNIITLELSTFFYIICNICVTACDCHVNPLTLSLKNKINRKKIKIRKEIKINKVYYL